jgi:hypothetical protein
MSPINLSVTLQKLLVIVILLTLTLVFHFRWENRGETLWPVSIPRIQYRFQEDVRALPFNHATQEYWETVLLPKNKGYIYKQNSPGAQSMYSLGMLHQLHCLGMLRSQFTAMMATPSAEDSGEGFLSPANKDLRNHLGHCLDLMRQVILPETSHIEHL